MNLETVGAPENLQQWFNPPLASSDGSFMVGYRNHQGLKFVAEVSLRGEAVTLTVKSDSSDLLLLNYVKWFIWVFGKGK